MPKQETRIGRDRGTAELDAQLRVEREANRVGFSVTRWMMPSRTSEAPQKPAFSGALSDYGPVASPLKMKMQVKKPSGGVTLYC